MVFHPKLPRDLLSVLLMGLAGPNGETSYMTWEIITR